MSESTNNAILVQEVPLDLIFPDPNQVRRAFDEEALNQLAESIREHRVIQPIVVRPIDKKNAPPYELIAGERRWRASKIAGRTTIPAVIRTDLVGQDVSVLQILENLQRQDLSLQETAAGVAKLVAAIGNAKAAEQLGKSEGWVSKHARIGDLPEQIRTIVESGKLDSADSAHELAQLVKLEPESYWTQRTLEAAEAGELRRAELRERLSNAQERLEKEKQRIVSAQAQAEREKALENDPKHQAKIKEAEKAEKKRLAEMNAAQREREARAKQAEKLIEACFEVMSKWVAPIESSLGVRASRFEDGEVDLKDCYIEDYSDATLAIEALGVHKYGQETLPDSPEGVRYRIEMHLEFSQVQKLLSAIAPSRRQSAAQESPEKQGQLCVSRFLAERTERVKGAKVKASELHETYVKWCRKNKLEALTLTSNAWGESIAAAGIEKVRSNGIQYSGIELKGG